MKTTDDLILQVKSEIRVLQDFLSRLESYSAQSSSVPKARKHPGGKSGALASHCIGVISTAGKRVRIDELLKSILDAGLEVGGVDEKSNLAGYLSRDPRVNYVKPDGWGLSA